MSADGFSKLPEVILNKVLKNLSPTELVRLSGTNKEFHKKILKEKALTVKNKIKTEFNGVNPNVNYELLKFLNRQYPFIIELFVLNEKTANLLSSIVEKTHSADVSGIDYANLITKYRTLPNANTFIYFYLYRYLLIAMSNPKFNKNFQDALDSTNENDILAAGNQIWETMDALVRTDEHILNAFHNHLLPQEMQNEWVSTNSKLRQLLQEYMDRYNERIHEIEEERLKQERKTAGIREASIKNKHAHAQASKVQFRRFRIEEAKKLRAASARPGP